MCILVVVDVWLDVLAADTSELAGVRLGEFDVKVFVRLKRVRVTVMVAGDDEMAAERLDVLETILFQYSLIRNCTASRLAPRLAPRHVNSIGSICSCNVNSVCLSI